MSILERRNRNCAETSYFLKYAKDITSQNGEDGIIERIFQLIGTSPNPFCVDVGAWDGVHLSNTFNLLKNKNWGGILFEADTFRWNGLKQLYRNRDDVICVNSLVQISGEQALGGLLSKYNIALDIDFLTIDVDGADYHLWKGIGNEYCPRVVCIEFNPTIPNNVYFIQEADTRIQQGSSLLAINELGNQLGYTLVATTIFNAIFVRNDLMSLIPPFPRDLDSLHAPEMCTEMFQTYDGEIKFVGPKKLLWHKLAINPQKMQVLSKKDRKFPFAPTWDTKIKLLERRLYDVVQELKSLVSLSEQCNRGGGDAAEDDEGAEWQLVRILQYKIISVHALFALFLTAASELVLFQFLEGIVLQAVTHFTHQLDSVVSAVCFPSDGLGSCCGSSSSSGSNSSGAYCDPHSPAFVIDDTSAPTAIITAPTRTPLFIKRSVLVPFTFALHWELSCFHEVRAEQVRSVSVCEAVEWLRRALTVMEPNFHHSLIAASSDSTTVMVSNQAGRCSSDVPAPSSEIMTESRLDGIQRPSAVNAAAASPFSCYDFLVQYSDVSDGIRAVLASTSAVPVTDLTESTASLSDAVTVNVCDLHLRDINLKLKLAKLSLTLESYFECSHYLSSGMAQVCELSSQASGSSSLNGPGTCSSQRISRTLSGSSSRSDSGGGGGGNLNTSTFTNASSSSSCSNALGLSESQSQQLAELIQAYWKQHQKYLHKMRDVSELEDKKLTALFSGLVEGTETVEIIDGSGGGGDGNEADALESSAVTDCDARMMESSRVVFPEAVAKKVNKKLPKPDKKGKESLEVDGNTRAVKKKHTYTDEEVQQMLQHQTTIEEQLRRSNSDLECQLEDMRTFSMALVGATAMAFVFGYLLGGGLGGGGGGGGDRVDGL